MSHPHPHATDTVLVTGVGEPGSLGYEIAAGYTAAGARVVITGRLDDYAPLAQRLDPTGSRVRFIQADLRHLEDVTRLARQAGPVSILVNNAATISAGPTAELDHRGFDAMYEVNVRAPHALVAAIVPTMVDAGRGHIVNISSIGARLATPGRAAYAATKAALESLTRSWALEFAPHGIRVNAISPGPMHGPKMIRNAGEEALRQVGTTVPLGRTVAPQEVARAVLVLTSSDLSYATGSVLALDGGRTLV